MDPRDSNLKQLKKVEYDKFEVEGDNNIPEMASNNLIGLSIGTLGTTTSKSTNRVPKRLRSTVWQHFWQVEVSEK